MGLSLAGIARPILKNQLSPGDLYVDLMAGPLSVCLAGATPEKGNDQIDVLLWEEAGGPSSGKIPAHIYREGVGRLVGLLPDLEVRPADGQNPFLLDATDDPQPGALACDTEGEFYVSMHGRMWANLKTGKIDGKPSSIICYSHWSLVWIDRMQQVAVLSF